LLQLPLDRPVLNSFRLSELLDEGVLLVNPDAFSVSQFFKQVVRKSFHLPLLQIYVLPQKVQVFEPRVDIPQDFFLKITKCFLSLQHLIIDLLLQMVLLNHPLHHHLVSLLRFLRLFRSAPILNKVTALATLNVRKVWICRRPILLEDERLVAFVVDCLWCYDCPLVGRWSEWNMELGDLAWGLWWTLPFRKLALSAWSLCLYIFIRLLQLLPFDADRLRGLRPFNHYHLYRLRWGASKGILGLRVIYGAFERFTLDSWRMV